MFRSISRGFRYVLILSLKTEKFNRPAAPFYKGLYCDVNDQITGKPAMFSFKKAA